MAILIAIAIPVFSAQLENAHHAVDNQLDRSAKSMAESHFLLDHANDKGVTDDYKIKFAVDGESNLTIASCSGTCSVVDVASIPADEQVLPQCTCDDHSKGGVTNAAGELEITVTPEGIVSSNWSTK